MAQVTLYLDDEISETVRQAAKAAGRSMSQWVSEAIKARIASEWPAAVRELAGAWPDMPTLEEIRLPRAADAEREAL